MRSLHSTVTFQICYSSFNTRIVNQIINSTLACTVILVLGNISGNIYRVSLTDSKHNKRIVLQDFFIENNIFLNNTTMTRTYRLLEHLQCLTDKGIVIEQKRWLL